MRSQGEIELGTDNVCPYLLVFFPEIDLKGVDGLKASPVPSQLRLQHSHVVGDLLVGLVDLVETPRRRLQADGECASIHWALR